MLGSVMDSEFGKLMTQPDEIGGVETQSSISLCRTRMRSAPG